MGETIFMGNGHQIDKLGKTKKMKYPREMSVMGPSLLVLVNTLILCSGLQGGIRYNVVKIGTLGRLASWVELSELLCILPTQPISPIISLYM